MNLSISLLVFVCVLLTLSCKTGSKEGGATLAEAGNTSIHDSGECANLSGVWKGKCRGAFFRRVEKIVRIEQTDCNSIRTYATLPVDSSPVLNVDGTPSSITDEYGETTSFVATRLNDGGVKIDYEIKGEDGVRKDYGYLSMSPTADPDRISVKWDYRVVGGSTLQNLAGLTKSKCNSEFSRWVTE